MKKERGENGYLDNCMYYLQEKGRILKIIDKTKNLKFYNENYVLSYYFFSLISLIVAIISIFLFFRFIINFGGIYNTFGIILSIINVILIFLTFIQKNRCKLIITYPSDNQIKINNKVFNFEREHCYISIKKEKKFYPSNNDMSFETYEFITYKLIIKENKKETAFYLGNDVKDFNIFVDNFEYEQLSKRIDE